MTVPSPTVATTGTGAAAITADNFNSYQIGGMKLADARGFSGVQNQTIYLVGYSANNDGGQGNFVWTLGTGTDDGGITTIVPTGNTSGYWARTNTYHNSYTPQTVDNTSGNVTMTAANVTNEVLICKNGSTPTNTFPSAASIISSMAGMQVGSIRDLLIINENSGTMTLAAGTGVTLTGNTFTMATATQRLFKIFIASSTTVTVYG